MSNSDYNRCHAESVYNVEGGGGRGEEKSMSHLTSEIAREGG